MKVSQPSTKTGRKPFVPPPIPLERPTVKELKKQEYLTMKLRSDPADANSQTYDLTIQFFRTGTPEEWLLFQRDLQRVLTGQNVNAGAQKFAMIRRLITGDTLTVFDNAANQRGNERNETFILCLQDVTNHIFPKRALSFQKRYMRRYLRKPRDMTTREFAARISEMNQYLKQFPPFEDNQELDEDEIIDILEFGIPHSWQNNMVLQGFDPMESTLAELVDFCERHEFTEGNKQRILRTIKEQLPVTRTKSQQQGTTISKAQTNTRMESSVNSIKPMDIPLKNARSLKHALQNCGPAGNKKVTAIRNLLQVKTPKLPLCLLLRNRSKLR